MSHRRALRCIELAQQQRYNKRRRIGDNFVCIKTKPNGAHKVIDEAHKSSSTSSKSIATSPKHNERSTISIEAAKAINAVDVAKAPKRFVGAHKVIPAPHKSMAASPKHNEGSTISIEAAKAVNAVDVAKAPKPFVTAHKVIHKSFAASPKHIEAPQFISTSSKSIATSHKPIEGSTKPIEAPKAINAIDVAPTDIDISRKGPKPFVGAHKIIEPHKSFATSPRHIEAPQSIDVTEVTPKAIDVAAKPIDAIVIAPNSAPNTNKEHKKKTTSKWWGIFAPKSNKKACGSNIKSKPETNAKSKHKSPITAVTPSKSKRTPRIASITTVNPTPDTVKTKAKKKRRTRKQTKEKIEALNKKNELYLIDVEEAICYMIWKPQQKKKDEEQKKEEQKNERQNEEQTPNKKKRVRKKARCNLCRCHRSIADEHTSDKKGFCSMAQDDGVIFDIDRLISHDAGSAHQMCIKEAIRLKKDKDRNEILKQNPLSLLQFMNEASIDIDANDERKDGARDAFLDIRSIFNTILKAEKKELYHLILPKMVNVYIACKKLSISTNAEVAFYLSSSIATHFDELGCKEFEPYEPNGIPFKYNNNTSVNTMLQFISEDISEKYVLPYYIQCHGIQHVFDGWRFHRELFGHAHRLTLVSGGKAIVKYVFAGFHKPHGRGATGAVPTLSESYSFHGADPELTQKKLKSILADRANINHGPKKGIIAQKKKELKMPQLIVFGCSDHDDGNAFKDTTQKENAHKEIHQAMTLLQILVILCVKEIVMQNIKK